MKNICRTSNHGSSWDDMGSLNDQLLFQETTLSESNQCSSGKIPSDSSFDCHSADSYQTKPVSGLSKLKSRPGVACLSFQMSSKGIITLFDKTISTPSCKIEKKYYQEKFGKKKDKQYNPYADATVKLEKEEIFQKKIKEEDIGEVSEEDFFDNKAFEGKHRTPVTFLESAGGKIQKQRISQWEVSGFYQYKMHVLSQNFPCGKDDFSTSRGFYDYKRVQPDRTIGSAKTIRIDVINSQLESFDNFLSIKNSSSQMSKDPKRRIFQEIIRKEINTQIKDEAFSNFIRLSLGEKINDDNSYLSWKTSVSIKLSEMSRKITKKILEGSSKKDLGQLKGGISFVDHYLISCKRILIKQIMRHSLFSVSIKINERRIDSLISRASMSYFLNKYSDFFLNEFIKNKEKDMSTKKMGGGYFSWKKLKIKSINRILDIAKPKFQALFESDHESIQKNVLILEESGFRSMTNGEFLGLIEFIKILLDSSDISGIIERACRHFYEEEHSKRYSSRLFKIFKNEKNESPVPGTAVKHEDSLHVNEPFVSYQYEHQKFPIREKLKRTKKIRKKNIIDEEKKDCFNKQSESYRRIMCLFLQKNGKPDDFSISKNIYDYRRVWWRKNLYFSKNERMKKGESIELTNSCLISFDPDLIKYSFNNHPFSENLNKRKFQEKMRKQIDEEEKKFFFLDFVSMSIPNGVRKISYKSWKSFILNKLIDLSNPIAEESFGENRKEKKVNQFIGKYLSFCTNSLVKEVLRHALISLPIKKEGDVNRIFVSRAGISYFLNQYANYFLSFLHRNNIDKMLSRGMKSSCILWRKSKTEQFKSAIFSFQSSFNSLVKSDHSNIQRDVLIFEKDGFRPMTNDEFITVRNTIHQLADPDIADGFIDKASRHFYREQLSKSKLRHQYTCGKK